MEPASVGVRIYPLIDPYDWMERGEAIGDLLFASGKRVGKSLIGYVLGVFFR